MFHSSVEAGVEAGELGVQQGRHSQAGAIEVEVEPLFQGGAVAMVDELPVVADTLEVGSAAVAEVEVGVDIAVVVEAIIISHTSDAHSLYKAHNLVY